MRHQKKTGKLGRERAQRKALMRSLADSLVLHGSITTTLAKAKALRPYIEKLVTKARKDTLATRRELLKVMYTKKAVDLLLKDVAPRYKDRNGGYTRITKVGPRRTDAAEMAVISFV